MMHSFEGLADEISALLKNAGDIGDSGRNRNAINGVGVTKMRTEVSPDENTLVTPTENFGDGKSQLSQSFKESVTSVTSVTKSFNGGLDDALLGTRHSQSHSLDAELSASLRSLPPSWIDGLAHLRTMETPGCFTAERWRHIVDDADAFLKQWGAAAANLGWSIHDLFGVHPAAPAVRFDAMGLIPLLHGNPVIALTETTVTLRGSSGSIQRFSRIHKVRGICLWEIGR